MTSAVAWMGAVQRAMNGDRRAETTNILEALDASPMQIDAPLFLLAYGGKWY